MQAAYRPVGYMEMPRGFGHRDLLARGKPVHEGDAFFARHPPMGNARRAKLFSPFDALAGFDEAVSSKDVLYEDKRELAVEDARELDRRIGILERLTYNGRVARANRPRVKVEYFCVCTDQQSFSYGLQGRYKTVSGICWRVDRVGGTIQVDQQLIPLSDVFQIENQGLFGLEWESA